MSSNPRLIDLTGQRFGRWTVITQSGNAKSGNPLWMCWCECGITRNVSGADLRYGKSKSCGCANRGRKPRRPRAKKPPNRLRGIWANMRARCYRPSSTSYRWYGAKGISVCEEWSDFAVFREWALSNGYRDDLTIERMDNSRNYEPDNCTWIERGAQSYNRDYTHKAPDGELWLHKARANGITGNAFKQRVAAGWGFEEASTWPANTRHMSRPRGPDGRFV